MSKLSKSILDTIHAKKITPQSRWYFFTIHSLLWVCFSITLTIGIIAVSLIFLEMSMPERPYIAWMPLPGPMRILPYLPFLWGFGALICITIAYFVFYKTDRGYRIPTLWIVGLLITGSFTGGYALHTTKINSFGEKQMQRFIAPYGHMRSEFQKSIPLPESGILPGKIESISDDGFIIKTPHREKWQVSFNCRDNACKEAQESLKKNQPMIFRGKIKKDGSNQNFEATSVESLPERVRCRKHQKDSSCGRPLIDFPSPKKETRKE